MVAAAAPRTRVPVAIQTSMLAMHFDAIGLRRGRYAGRCGHPIMFGNSDLGGVKCCLPDQSAMSRWLSVCWP
jgi:hypothetical protein